ncbi:MAG: MFS transporter [Pseudomonadota bacterium]
MEHLSQTEIKQRQGAVLAIIMASYLMIVIDISIVITGLPKIKDALGFSPASLSWVQNAYTLAFGGFLLLGARAGDLLGRRRMFISGLGLFTFASLAIGMAPSPSWLLAFRAVQGVGAAILAPSTLALIALYFPEGTERTRALSYYAAAAGIGATLGLVLGGLFADLLSWRAGFFINLPIGIALMLAAQRLFAETPKHSGQFDVAGALSSTLGMSSLVFGIVHSAEQGWAHPLTAWSIGVGMALMLLFVLIERRVKQPVLPLRLFASKERCGAYVARMLFLGGMVGFWFFATQFLQGVLGYRPLEAGLAFLPATLPQLIVALTVPMLVHKFGNTNLLVGGLAFCIAGLAWLGQATAHTSYLTGIALPMILLGIGQGAVLGPLTVAAVTGVAAEDSGAASGLVNVAHQLGGSLGLGVLVVVFTAASSSIVNGPEVLAHRIASVMDASAVMLALSLVTVLTLILPAQRQQVETSKRDLSSLEPEPNLTSSHFDSAQTNRECYPS